MKSLENWIFARQGKETSDTEPRIQWIRNKIEVLFAPFSCLKKEDDGAVLTAAEKRKDEKKP
jgi:hypothetical protein